MDFLLALIMTFLLLLFSVINGIFLAYPLTVGMALFFMVAMRRGFKAQEVFKMACRGGKKALLVIKIFILIGTLIPAWMASGTIPAIVYYGIKFIKPDLFILSSFLISCFVSFLIGTSIGTTGVVGASLMLMARSGGVSISAVAGAIIAGVYFGDRCSPVSSSASLVASLTETNVYDNIKEMFKTSMIPFIISAVIYLLISYRFPLHDSSKIINSQILDEFSVNLAVLTPVLVIIIFSIVKIDVKLSMLFSVIVAFALSMIVQHNSAESFIRFIVFGFSMDATSPLSNIIKGGGIVSMLKTGLVVFISSAFAGIMEDGNMLSNIENITSRATTRYEVYRNVLLTSILGAVLGCSQTFAVMLAHILNKKAYIINRLDNKTAAIDLENTAIMISALVPWNMALLVPMTILGIGVSCIPYMIFAYLLPLWNLLYLKLHEKTSENVELKKSK